MTGGCRSTFATSLRVPEAPPPVPIAATFDLAANVMTVDFDQPLQVSPLDAPNWNARIQGFRRSTTQVFTSPALPDNRVTARQWTIDLMDPGPDVVSYRPPPFDVLSVPGTPAPLFLDFPVTVV